MESLLVLNPLTLTLSRRERELNGTLAVTPASFTYSIAFLAQKRAQLKSLCQFPQ